MPRLVKCGLIQCSNVINDEKEPIEKIQQAMFDKHIPFIEKAGKDGVQILGLQEIFNGPYFCPSQDQHWYGAAESVPGPTVEALIPYAKKYEMVLIIPVYEREQAGVYYNTAAVVDCVTIFKSPFIYLILRDNSRSRALGSRKTKQYQSICQGIAMDISANLRIFSLSSNTSAGTS